MRTINFLLAGVGGQGTILASDVLVNVGLRAGLQAKQAEVHGMSQRGGDVTSHVRWGQKVYSPLAGAGEVDVLLAFEKVEALRNLRFCRRGALVIVNDQAILPLTVTSGGQPYPDDESVRRAVAQVTERAVYLDGAKLAEEAGTAKAANVVLLGALSALLNRIQGETREGRPRRDRACTGPYECGSHFGLSLAQEGLAPEFDPDLWMQVIGERVPARYLEVNRRAFAAGRAAVVVPA